MEQEHNIQFYENLVKDLQTRKKLHSMIKYLNCIKENATTTDKSKVLMAELSNTEDTYKWNWNYWSNVNEYCQIELSKFMQKYQYVRKIYVSDYDGEEYRSEDKNEFSAFVDKTWTANKVYMNNNIVILSICINGDDVIEVYKGYEEE